MANRNTNRTEAVIEDDLDLTGPFAYTSPTAMMVEGLVNMVLRGELDKAKALCEKDGFGWTTIKKKAEALRRAEREKVKAAAKEAERRSKAPEKPAEPSDDSEWGLAGGCSDPNEGVPWGESAGADAWLRHFNPDLVKVVEVLSLAYESAKNAGIDWQCMDEIAGHKIPVNAIVTRNCDYSEWYDSIAPHVEELGGNTELETEWVEEPIDDEEDDCSSADGFLHVSWTIAWGVRKKLLKRFGEMAERLELAASNRREDSSAEGCTE